MTIFTQAKIRLDPTHILSQLLTFQEAPATNQSGYLFYTVTVSKAKSLLETRPFSRSPYNPSYEDTTLHGATFAIDSTITGQESLVTFCMKKQRYLNYFERSETLSSSDKDLEDPYSMVLRTASTRAVARQLRMTKFTHAKIRLDPTHSPSPSLREAVVKKQSGLFVFYIVTLSVAKLLPVAICI